MMTDLTDYLKNLPSGTSDKHKENIETGYQAKQLRDPLSVSTSCLLLFFSSSLSVIINAECLHNYISFSFKTQAKKRDVHEIS